MRATEEGPKRGDVWNAVLQSSMEYRAAMRVAARCSRQWAARDNAVSRQNYWTCEPYLPKSCCRPELFWRGLSWKPPIRGIVVSRREFLDWCVVSTSLLLTIVHSVINYRSSREWKLDCMHILRIVWLKC